MDQKIFLNPEIVFRKLGEKDVSSIVDSFSQIGWNKPSSLFEKYLEEQKNNQRCVFLAFKENIFAGYITLKWQSEYPPFRMQNISEISDLNVLPKFRKQGIATGLLDLAEGEARTKSGVVGIGVGLTSDYGSAQKLYVQRGYLPDGHGITYDCQIISFGSKVTVDDALVLWLTKKLV